MNKLVWIVSGIFLAAVLVAGLALGVVDSNSDDTTTSASSDTPTWGDNLDILLGSSNLSVDEPRETILLRDGFQRIDDVERVAVAVYPVGAASATWQGDAIPYGDNDGTYWVVAPEFSEPGAWTFEVTVYDTNGNNVTRSIDTTVHDEAYGIGIGEPAPVVESFTLTSEDRPDRITTDITPNDAYYQMSVAEAVTSGRPSVIVLGTPELCTRKLWNLCGAVLDGLDAVVEDYGDRVNFVHVEIYNLDTGKYVEAWEAYALEVSPWIYVIDADGTVAMRYDAIVGPGELVPQLDAMLAG